MIEETKETEHQSVETTHYTSYPVIDSQSAEPVRPLSEKKTRKPRQKTAESTPDARNGAGATRYLLLSEGSYTEVGQSGIQNALADVVKNPKLELVRVTVLVPQLGYTEM